MRFENEQLLQYRTVWTRRPAELRKCFFSERLILNEALPSPFCELRRLYVRCCIEKNDGTAIRPRFDQVPNQQEIRYGQVVEGMTNPPAPALRSAHPPLLCEEGNASQQYKRLPMPLNVVQLSPSSHPA